MIVFSYPLKRKRLDEVLTVIEAFEVYRVRDLNPCYRRERPAS